MGSGRSVGRVKRVLLLWNTASAFHPGNVYGVPPCCSLERRTSVRGRLSPVGRKLFRRIWSAVDGLHSEPKPLPGPRSKPPDLVTACSNDFADLHLACKTRWPVFSDDLLGIRT